MPAVIEADASVSGGRARMKSVTAKTFMLVAIAAFGAGILVLLTSVAPKAMAEPVHGTIQFTKGDRLAVQRTDVACASQNWPHYDQTCQFDRRRPADELRAVRIIALR